MDLDANDLIPFARVVEAGSIFCLARRAGARKKGITTVAEGVENDAIYSLLGDFDCSTP